RSSLRTRSVVRFRGRLGRGNQLGSRSRGGGRRWRGASFQHLQQTRVGRLHVRPFFSGRLTSHGQPIKSTGRIGGILFFAEDPTGQPLGRLFQQRAVHREQRLGGDGR